MWEDQLWGEATKRKMLVVVAVGDFQRFQCPVEVSTERQRRVHCDVKKAVKRASAWLISDSLLLAVHRQSDVCVVEHDVDIVRYELVELFHSFSLDELSGFTH